MLTFLISAVIASSQPLIIERVKDGDTVLLTNKTVIRLAAIDAPELKQRFGPEAKLRLERLLGTKGAHPKDLVVVSDGKDKYGRTLVYIYDKNININAELVRKGYAWSYMSKQFLPQQLEAQKAKRGLWKDKSPTPPWVWRKQKKDAK